MKNRRNRFLAFGMGCVLGFSCVFSSYATNADLKDAKNKMSSLQEEKKKVQDTLKQLEGLKSDAAAYVKELDIKLTSLDAELSQLEKDISAKESQIKDTKAELEEAKAVEKEQYASMKLRIQYMYENGNVSFADSIMTSKDVSQLLNRAEYTSQIASYDRKMLKGKPEGTGSGGRACQPVRASGYYRGQTGVGAGTDEFKAERAFFL